MPRERTDRAGEMEAFATVAREGSLSGAARTLGLTPSAVSRIVARIEARLGVRLLVRTTRRLRVLCPSPSWSRRSSNTDEPRAAGRCARTPRTSTGAT